MAIGKQNLPARKRAVQATQSIKCSSKTLKPISARQPAASIAHQARLTQTHLNLSSKPVHVTCSKCEMQYQALCKEDQKAHDKYCGLASGNIRWPFKLSHPGISRVDETVASTLPAVNTATIAIKYGEADATLRTKLDEISSFIDRDLHAAPITPCDMAHSTFYLLVENVASYAKSNAIYVTACAVVRAIKTAYQATVTAHSASSAHHLLRFGEDGEALFCSPEPRPAMIGIDRIWTSPLHRKGGRATALLDHIARTFVYGLRLEGPDRARCIAFSQPSSAGSVLFKRWTGTAAILVFVEE